MLANVDERRQHVRRRSAIGLGTRVAIVALLLPLAIPSVAHASPAGAVVQSSSGNPGSGPLPSAATAYGVLVNITNGGPNATGTYDQRIDIDSLAYSDIINSNWTNGAAYYASNDSPIYGWIESNASNSSTDTRLWVRLASIEPFATIGVVFVFQPKAAFLLSESGFMGESPLLSSRYAEFDNGWKVFNFYDNFSGSSLSSAWTESGSWTYTVDKGFFATGGPGAGGSISSTATFPYPETVDFYGDEYQTGSATSFYVEGIGGSGCSACYSGDSIGWDSQGPTGSGPSPNVVNGGSYTYGSSVSSTQKYGVYSATAVDGTFAQFYVNGSFSQALSATLPTSPQPVGLAGAGYPSGTFTNTQTTYWIRERTPANTFVGSSARIGPPTVALTAYPGTLAINESLTLVAATGAWGTVAYSYAGLPSGCTTADRSSLSCVVRATGQFVVTVSVTDVLGDVAMSGTNVTVLSAPNGAGTPLSATLVADPSPVGVNGTLVLLTGVSGGIGPYAYAYSALPTGCSNSDASAILCRPSAAGTFSPIVTVTDYVGSTTSATSAVTVTPAPAPASLTVALTAYAGVFESTQPLLIAATVSGGSGPFTYSYTGLPRGCESSNASSLACIPNATGTFTIHVEVTDPIGGSASAATSVTLAAAPTASSAVSEGTTIPSWELPTLGGLAVVGVLIAIVALVRSGGSRRS